MMTFYQKQSGYTSNKVDYWRNGKLSWPILRHYWHLPLTEENHKTQTVIAGFRDLKKRNKRTNHYTRALSSFHIAVVLVNAIM